MNNGKTYLCVLYVLIKYWAHQYEQSFYYLIISSSFFFFFFYNGPNPHMRYAFNYELVIQFCMLYLNSLRLR